MKCIDKLIKYRGKFFFDNVRIIFDFIFGEKKVKLLKFFV